MVEENKPFPKEKKKKKKTLSLAFVKKCVQYHPCRQDQ